MIIEVHFFLFPANLLLDVCVCLNWGRAGFIIIVLSFCVFVLVRRINRQGERNWRIWQSGQWWTFLKSCLLSIAIIWVIVFFKRRRKHDKKCVYDCYSEGFGDGGDHVFVQCMCCMLQAMTYLSYVLYPLVLGGAVYSLLYVSHKRSVFSWWPWKIRR